MTTTAIAERQPAASVLPADIEKVLVEGNLSALKPEQRVAYYNATCQSLGLNPLTTPFDYINLNGKLRLYAKKDAADQLRRVYEVSVTIAARELVEGVCVVTARASMPTGRQDESIGAVSVKGKTGEELANAWMKAETKAKRRVTLSICGLGFLDESETGSIRGARTQPAAKAHASLAQAGADIVDTATGEVIDAEQAPQQAPGMISEAQRKRLFAIAKRVGWSHEDIKQLLTDGHNIGSTRDIPVDLYDHIVTTIEADDAQVAEEEGERDVI